MILYLDTSALVKIYIAEAYSKEILSLVKKSKVVGSHMLAYVEAHAAFSRVKRENKMTEKDYERVKQAFTQDWENYLQIESTKTLIHHAADLAEAFSLRAYDSIHLAAADLIVKQAKKDVIFACFDKHLCKAAKVLGLGLMD